MSEKDQNIKKLEESIQNTPFEIPDNTSTYYYLKVIKKMIVQDADTTWDKNTIIVEDETGKIEKDIYRIGLFFGKRMDKTGLLFRIKTKRSDNGIEMDNFIETTSVRPGIISEREELSFIYNDQKYRYNYLREYNEKGTCIYHYHKDLVKKIIMSAKLYDKGLVISKYDIESDTGKSILIGEQKIKDKKEQISKAIKRGKIFSLIDSDEGIEIPYKPYPLSEIEFEELISKLD